MSLAEILGRWAFSYMARLGLLLLCCSEPDTSGQVKMAEVNEKLGNRSMDLAERQYADQSGLTNEFMDLVRQNSASDQKIKDLQFATSQEEADRRRNIFSPLEAGLVDEAKNFDSPERMSNEMGKADAAVMQAYERAMGSASRDQLRMGVNPNSAKAMALRENGALDLAASAANASTGAGERIKSKGFGMRMDAAGLGRNLVSNQTAAADSAVRAGQSGVNSFQSGVDQGNRNFSTTMQGFGAAGSAFTNAGNLYGAAAEAEAAGDPMNGLAKLAGVGVQKLACGG